MRPFPRPVRPWAVALTVVVLLGGTGVAWAAFSATTANGGNQLSALFTVEQAAGTDGCISDGGSGGTCATGHAMNGVIETDFDPTGTHLYAVSETSGSVTAFRRTSGTGRLDQLPDGDGCIRETSTAATCKDGRALTSAQDIAVSPDGKHVYVAAGGADAIAVLARDTATGILSQAAGLGGCISEDGTGGTCTDGTLLIDPYDVKVSPDGKHVYVAAGPANAVLAFARDATSGALTQLGCVSQDGSGGACATGRHLSGIRAVVVSGDGSTLYAAAEGADAVTAFSRNATSGALTQRTGSGSCVGEHGSMADCTDGRGLDSVRALALAPDGTQLYAASFGPESVAVLDVGGGGGLTQAADATGCAAAAGGTCATAVALGGAWEIAATSSRVWVAARNENAVARFFRDTTSGDIAQPAPPAGCLSDTGSSGQCVDGRNLLAPRDVTASPDGQHVYVAASNSNTIAIVPR